MRTTSDMSRRQLAWKGVAALERRARREVRSSTCRSRNGPVGRGGGGGGGGGGGAGRGLAGVTTFLATLRSRGAVVLEELGALHRVDRAVLERDACRPSAHENDRGRIPLPVDPRRDDARIFLDEALFVVRVRLSVQILFIVPVDVFALRGRGRRRRGAGVATDRRPAAARPSARMLRAP